MMALNFPTIYHFKVKVFHIENIWHRRVVINMSFVCHVVENTKCTYMEIKVKNFSINFKNNKKIKQQKKKLIELKAHKNCIQ